MFVKMEEELTEEDRNKYISTLKSLLKANAERSLEIISLRKQNEEERRGLEEHLQELLDLDPLK
tara:strand:+ start:505 stop:696 length:192 start_codon:yes stop_codon:yes gene_type:complete